MLKDLTFEYLNPKQLNLSQLMALVEVSQKTFKETFGAVYTVEDANDYLEERLNPKRLQWEVTEEPNALFYLIKVASQVVGYIKMISPHTVYLNPSNLPLTPKKSTFLERFYLIQSVHSTGLASVALQLVLSTTKITLNSDFIYLTVWEHNLKARRFYEKSGFTSFDKTTYTVGQQVDIDHLYGLAIAN